MKEPYFEKEPKKTMITIQHRTDIYDKSIIINPKLLTVTCLQLIYKRIRTGVHTRAELNESIILHLEYHTDFLAIRGCQAVKGDGSRGR
jgi:hypothetical protein